MIPKNNSVLTIPLSRRYFGPKTVDYFNNRKRGSTHKDDNSSKMESSIVGAADGLIVNRNSISFGVDYQDICEMIDDEKLEQKAYNY